MIEGLLLDWVYAPSNEFSVRIGIEGSAPVLPDAADTEFPVGDHAVMAAQETGDLAVIQLFVKQGFSRHNGGPSSKEMRVTLKSTLCSFTV